jgi:hypothetical protein
VCGHGADVEYGRRYFNDEVLVVFGKGGRPKCVFFAPCSCEFALVSGGGHGLCGSLYARHGVTQERGSFKYGT